MLFCAEATEIHSFTAVYAVGVAPHLSGRVNVLQTPFIDSRSNRKYRVKTGANYRSVTAVPCHMLHYTDTALPRHQDKLKDARTASASAYPSTKELLAIRSDAKRNFEKSCRAS